MKEVEEEGETGGGMVEDGGMRDEGGRAVSLAATSSAMVFPVSVFTNTWNSSGGDGRGGEGGGGGRRRIRRRRRRREDG